MLGYLVPSMRPITARIPRISSHRCIGTEEMVTVWSGQFRYQIGSVALNSALSGIRAQILLVPF